MGLSLNKIKADTRRVEADVQGETLVIYYKKNAYTPAFFQRMREAQDSGAVDEGLILSTKELVVSWDLKWNEDDKEYVPLEDEVMKEIPVVIYSAIYKAINDDQSVEKKLLTLSPSSYA